MFRLAAFLLILFMPLQSAWAAISPYCSHESETARHLGHHEHQYEADREQSQPDNTPKLPGSIDSDCGICCASCTVVILAAFQELIDHRSAHALADYLERFAFLPLAEPERPKWATPA